MEIWVPKAGIAPASDRIEVVWEAWWRDSPKDESLYSEIGGAREGVVGRHGARIATILSLPRACHGGRRIGSP
jgi:hypothetical protein